MPVERLRWIMLGHSEADECGDLAPTRLAIMHGSSFEGDNAAALRALADEYDRRLEAAMVSPVRA